MNTFHANILETKTCHTGSEHFVTVTNYPAPGMTQASAMWNISLQNDMQQVWKKKSEKLTGY
jgi:hypothetical protein